MNKYIIRNGIITALLASNVIVGYQFHSTYTEQENIIKEKENQIQTLLDVNFERNNLVEKQQGVIHTYEEEVLKLNNQIEQKEIEVDKLTKQLSEMRKKIKESP